MQGTTNSYGYLTCNSADNRVWTNAVTCPTDKNCAESAFTKFTYGYLVFNGDGKVTMAFTEYYPTGPARNGCGNGTYTVSATGSGSTTLPGIPLLFGHAGIVAWAGRVVSVRATHLFDGWGLC